MSIKIIAYSIKSVFGVPTLSTDLSSRILEVKFNEHIIIDAPVTGIKTFNWFAYIVKSHIFDNGSCFMMLCDYKKVDRKYALQYLLNYERDGRINCKDYSLKTPKKVNYQEYIDSFFKS